MRSTAPMPQRAEKCYGAKPRSALAWLLSRRGSVPSTWRHCQENIAAAWRCRPRTWFQPFCAASCGVACARPEDNAQASGDDQTRDLKKSVVRSSRMDLGQVGGVEQGHDLNKSVRTNPLVETALCTRRPVLDGPIFSQGSVHRHFCVHLGSVPDGPTFSQGSLSPNCCGHLVSCAEWTIFSQGSPNRIFCVHWASCAGRPIIFSRVP